MLKPTTTFIVIDAAGDTRGPGDPFETFESALGYAQYLATHTPMYAPYSVRARTETPLQQVYADGPSYNPVVALAVLPALQGVAA